jgi:hypothetical protein
MLVLMGAANANISGDGSEPTAGSKPEDSTSPTRQRAGPSDNPEGMGVAAYCRLLASLFDRINCVISASFHWYSY